MSSHSYLRSLLEKYTLTGPNYIEWRRNLKIVLRFEKIVHVLDEPHPPEPVEGSSRAVMTAYEKAKDAYEAASCIMLGSMDSELQK